MGTGITNIIGGPHEFPIGLTNFKNSEVNRKLTLMYNIRNVIGPLDTDCWLYLPYHFR
jgi:hypothetical protein